MNRCQTCKQPTCYQPGDAPGNPTWCPDCDSIAGMRRKARRESRKTAAPPPPPVCQNCSRPIAEHQQVANIGLSGQHMGHVWICPSAFWTPAK